MIRLPALLLALFVIASATAQIQPIPPFVGAVRDSVDSYTSTFIISDHLTILDGGLTVRSHNGSTLVHLISGSTLGGDRVVPRSPSWMLGITEGPVIWEFNTPALQIGAYWDTNSGANDATAQFFDVGGDLIGTQVVTIPSAANQWVWNGWESNVPIGRMVITGNGVLHGFLWNDDFEMTSVPEPASGLMLVLLMATGVGSRRHFLRFCQSPT
jgi:hypothetical protein